MPTTSDQNLGDIFGGAGAAPQTGATGMGTPPLNPVQQVPNQAQFPQAPAGQAQVVAPQNPTPAFRPTVPGQAAPQAQAPVQAQAPQVPQPIQTQISQPQQIPQQIPQQPVQQPAQQIPQVPQQTAPVQTAQMPMAGQQFPGQAMQIPNQNRKPQVQATVKKGSKISMKGFLIGCGVFLLLLAGAGSAVLYFFTKNPEQLNGVMDIETVKSLLKVFATIFFGFLFFLGFAFVILNGYRLAKVKTGRKVGFVAGLVMGLGLVIGSIAGGTVTLQHINEIAGKEVSFTNNIVLIKVPMKGGMYYLHDSPGLQLIAPMSLQFTVNNQVLDKTLTNTIGNDALEGMQLDCGNGQAPLNLIQGSRDFGGSCLFTEKGSYNMLLKFLHKDRQTGSPKESELSLPLQFVSQVDISTSNGEYSLNDNKTEISVGKAPSKVFFDIGKVFSDFQLNEYKLFWDLDADGSYDKQDDVSFAHRFRNPQVHTVYYTIPALGNYIYPLSFRVEQSDVPICDLELQHIKETTYNIIAHCDDKNGPIITYNFDIIEEGSDKLIESVQSKHPQTKYDFPSAGNYYVELTFITDENKKGGADSDSISIGDINFEVNYDITYRGPNDDEWKKFVKKGEEVFDLEKKEITLSKLPMRLQVSVNGVTPVVQGTNIAVQYDGKPLLSQDDKTFEFVVEKSDKTNIDILVLNSKNEEETKVTIPVLVDQAKIIGDLQAFPDSVGESPFTVKLDASTTDVTDPDDRIVYFSWDFGDGQKNANASQGIIEHTYLYNDELENGKYTPSVTITTQKGIVEVVTLDRPIIVKKPRLQARISVDSHPSQQAHAGEMVQFSIQTDGTPDTIVWDFGDGQKLELEGRAGTEVSHLYEQAGEYKIKAAITYDNKTTSDPSIKLVVD